MEPVPAVVTPLDEHMGLDIARSLGKRGIPVYGIDSDSRAPGRYSKFCHFVQSPDPDEDGESAYLQFLMDFGKKLGGKAVLYPLSDWHVLLCSRERSSLRQYYEYVMPDEETVTSLTTKDGLYTIAEKYNIPAPRTVFVSAEHEIESVAEIVNYPTILKPTESTYWHEPQIAKVLRSGLLAGRAKVILCQDPSELLKAYHLIAPFDNRLIVQEVIPGEDSRLVYISFYMNRRSEPLGIFAGRKHRIVPIGFGSASYVRSLYDPRLVESGLELLSKTHYMGLGGIEFKEDPRDGCYRLIEVNTRFGMWDGLGIRCGVDLPYIAYRDMLGLPVEPQLTYREGVIWIDWQRDIRAAVEYRRRGQLSWGEWLQSLRGEKMSAIYSADDWRPGAAFTISLAYKLLSRLTKR